MAAEPGRRHVQSLLKIALAAFASIVWESNGFAQSMAWMRDPRALASFDGASVTTWRMRLRHGAGASDLLIAGMPQSAGVVAVLLRSGDEEAVVMASEICRDAGSRSQVLSPDLVRCLSTSPFWMARANSAVALGRIGEVGAEAREALLDCLCTTDIPRLRADCARSLVRVDPMAPDSVLQRVRDGRFADVSSAANVLSQMGDLAVDAVVACIGQRASTTETSVAWEAVRKLGWRAVDQLERLGFSEEAALILREHPLAATAWGEFAVVESSQVAVLDALPRVVWVSADKEASTAWVCDGCFEGNAFKVIRVRITGSAPGAAVVLEAADVPADRAKMAVRQVAVIAGTKIRLEMPEGVALGVASREFAAAVGFYDQGLASWCAAFVGRATTENLIERFMADAGARVMNELVADVPWRELPPSSSDQGVLESARDLLRKGLGAESWTERWLSDAVHPRRRK
jgi:hypothetical protein